MLELFEGYVAGMVTQLVTAGLAQGNVEPHRALPTQDEKLPAAGVTYMQDHAKAPGDPRADVPDFVHRTVFVIDVVDRADSGPALRTKIAVHSTKICDSVLGNLSWGGDTLEGIEALSHVIDIPPEGAHVLGRLQVQITTLTRSEWKPSTTSLNNLTAVHVAVDTGSGDDSPPTGATIPVPTI